MTADFLEKLEQEDVDMGPGNLTGSARVKHEDGGNKMKTEPQPGTPTSEAEIVDESYPPGYAVPFMHSAGMIQAKKEIDEEFEGL